ncbi:MAG: hypothetical protein ACFFEA_13235 [Candidatus Thorarchaeota archaeon]
MRKVQEILLTGFLLYISICVMLAITHELNPSIAYSSFLASISGVLLVTGILLFALLLASVFYYRDASS